LGRSIFSSLRWSSVLPVFLGLGACDPSPPAEPPSPPEIDPGPQNGGSGNIFEAGPVDATDLEDLRDAACVTEISELVLPPVFLQFVVDVSGSMSLPPPGETTSKWESTKTALSNLVSSLAEEANVGAVYFPNQATSRNCTLDEGECEPGEPVEVSACIDVEAIVPLDALGSEDSGQRELFQEGLERVNPAGGTPTHDAYLLGLEQLKGGQPVVERVVVLITDGQPTYLEGCSGSGNLTEPVDEQPIIRAIRAAADEGVHTFVVGAPGSDQNTGTEEDARPWLSRAAFVGGTGPSDCERDGPNFCHFDLTGPGSFSVSLNQALGRILGETKVCSFDVPQPPNEQTVDPNEVNVILTSASGDAEVVGRGDNDCTEGWRYRQEQQVIELCPESCESYQQSTLSKVEVLFGCEAAPVIPPT
jgi:hypothetical protein